MTYLLETTCAYAGAAPGMVNGVIQINFQIGATASGEYSLSANGKASDPFTIFCLALSFQYV
jgi:uncharacterized protein (TIGR03437 family)